MDNKFLLEAFQTPDNVADRLKPYFSSLKIDPYIDGDYRFRAYSQYKKINDKFVRQTHAEFVQSSKVNKLLGDVKRTYPDLDSKMDDLPEFQHLLNSFCKHSASQDQLEEIFVHQIRVVSQDSHMGEPAPEGIHQDGFQYVGIFCVNRDNVDGGFTQLFSSPVERPHLYTVLEENQFLIINDKRYYHYVSQTLAHDKSKKGIRDVFVFTA